MILEGRRASQPGSPLSPTPCSLLHPFVHAPSMPAPSVCAPSARCSFFRGMLLSFYGLDLWVAAWCGDQLPQTFSDLCTDDDHLVCHHHRYDSCHHHRYDGCHHHRYDGCHHHRYDGFQLLCMYTLHVDSTCSQVGSMMLFDGTDKNIRGKKPQHCSSPLASGSQRKKGTRFVAHSTCCTATGYMWVPGSARVTVLPQDAR